MIRLFDQFNAAQYVAESQRWEGNPDAFEVRWMLSRIGHWCRCLSTEIGRSLNSCGWMFRDGDQNCRKYDTKQGLDRLDRLIQTQVNKISGSGEMSHEDFCYSWGLVSSFAVFPKEWDFLSGQESDTMMKIYRKYLKRFDNYANRQQFD